MKKRTSPGCLQPGFFLRQIGTPMPNDLAILGAGNMAEAIARAVTRANVFRPDQIIASDPSDTRRDLFQSELHVHTTQDNREAVRGATTVLLSVKPQQMADVLAAI